MSKTSSHFHYYCKNFLSIDPIKLHLRIWTWTATLRDSSKNCYIVDSFWVSLCSFFQMLPIHEHWHRSVFLRLAKLSKINFILLFKTVTLQIHYYLFISHIMHWTFDLYILGSQLLGFYPGQGKLIPQTQDTMRQEKAEEEKKEGTLRQLARVRA